MSWQLRISLAALLLLTTSVRADEPIDGIAAIVGEDVILRSEVDSTMAPVLARIRAQQGPVTPELARQVHDEALRSLIDDRLLLKVAERNNMEASAEEIDQAIDGIASDEGVSVEEIYAAVSSQGLTREQYRSQLGTQLTKMRIISGSMQSRVSISEDEVRELYKRRFGNVSAGERLRVLHILLPWPQDGSAALRDQVQEMARSVRARALESGDFAGLARRVSAAPTAAQGGLTVFRQGEAPPAIEQALSSLSPGEISSIVETEHGLNLFQFIDRFDPSQVTLADVEGQLRYEIQERKSGPELEKWLEELRQRQYIEIVDLE